MIKVLFCTPLGGVGGGISRWAGHLMNYYKTRGNTNVQIEPFPMNRYRLIVKISIWKRIIYGLLDYWRIYCALGKKLKRDHYNIVHLATSASISLFKDILILRRSRANGIKTIIHFHFGRIPDIFLKKNWEWHMLRLSIRLADRVVVIDQTSYDTLIAAGYKHVVYIPNPLAPDVTSFVEKYMDKCPRYANMLLFAGHVVKTKGVYELVVASRDIPGIKLKIMGAVSTDVKNELQSLATKDNDCSWLEICGERPYEEILEAMMTCSVFVLPTYTEGFPNVILESMACGCPIVTTDVGAIPEMLDIKNGFNYGICVTPRDVPQLRAAILKMLNDTKYALQCGNNAQKRVYDCYSIPMVWNKLMSVWEEVS